MLIFLCSEPAYGTAGAPQHQGLTLAQIEKLIQIQTPDDVIAQEIRSRGLAFIPTPKTLEGLRQGGAGQATLTAVRDRMPTGTLEIQAPPYSQVEVDGTERGTTDNLGRLVLADLSAGAHRLVVNKAGYRPGDFSLTLAAREYKHFSAQLDWAGGYLSVRPGSEGVSIAIERMGTFANEVTDLPCPPGTYTITVSSPKYKSAQKIVEAIAGQTATASFSLEADPGYLQRNVAEIQTLYTSQNYLSAMGSAKELLSLNPKNKDALRFLAQSYFLTSDFGKFAATASEALDNGGYIQVRLNHHHAMGSALHPIILEISAASLSFDPQTSARAVCNYKAFTTPVATILHAEMTRNNNNEVYLNLKISDVKNPKKVINLNFADLESHFIQTQKSGGGIIAYEGHQLISRPQAEEAGITCKSLEARRAQGSITSNQLKQAQSSICALR
ncbi:MAG: hypothetical protein DMG49_01210 [Acidobacteria bacterium]|nr:MAG: hypothetical protein DMG49_01210 [Acidobacteriota bacterium]